MWSERFDDKVRAEGVSVSNYTCLRVEQGTIIHATKDFKALNFKEILKEHLVENPDRYIEPSNSIGGWNKFIKNIPSEHSYPALLLAEQLVHQRFVHLGPLVLEADFLQTFPTPMTDRDRTVSRRSEPSSRTALNGEQPNPWDLLQPQDAMSRHRGAKLCRRYELLGKISLLIPGVPFIR